MLRQFWDKFIADVSSVKTIEVANILKAVTDDLEVYAFSSADGESISKACPACGTGDLVLNIGKSSAFLGCNRYPECRYTRGLGCDSGSVTRDDSARILGIDEETHEEIILKNGPYGEYLQLGNSSKRVSIPKCVGEVNAEMALKLLSLPVSLGVYPKTNKDIKLGIGRFGPYVLYDGVYFSIKDRDDFLNITYEEAINIIDSQGDKKAKLLGQYADGKEIYVCKGRYGFYLKCGKVNVAIKGKTENISLEEAIELLEPKMR